MSKSQKTNLWGFDGLLEALKHNGGWILLIFAGYRWSRGKFSREPLHMPGCPTLDQKLIYTNPRPIWHESLSNHANYKFYAFSSSFDLRDIKLVGIWCLMVCYWIVLVIWPGGDVWSYEKIHTQDEVDINGFRREWFEGRCGVRGRESTLVDVKPRVIHGLYQRTQTRNKDILICMTIVRFL